MTTAAKNSPALYQVQAWSDDSASLGVEPWREGAHSFAYSAISAARQLFEFSHGPWLMSAQQEALKSQQVAWPFSGAECFEERC